MIPPKSSPLSNFRGALKRGESVTTLVSLIQNLSGPYVIAVDSPWGTGKTTFLGFLRAVLEADGIRLSIL